MTPPNIIDIEASGFGTGSYPIEIGYISRYRKVWCSLIIPTENWLHWDQSAESLHKISRDTLFEHGKDVGIVAAHLNDVFQNQTVYTDGWLQDFTWISRLFELAEIRPHFKLEDLRTILTPHQESIWHETKQSIFHELQARRHRASADAQVLQMTWVKTAESEAQTSTYNRSHHNIY
ncbi:MAG: hypothetical protein COB34_03715 [Methylophilaceae bacterium]|nr:MAG: hypothetical protein COB34_03715 [Methylophilaceae bacterium]